ncbi:MAG: helix-turn-helix domain-containing protein [Gammaproteobacteria bacterium]|nr:helix-turn-helix domain-containing protein [Gammaproteobacteria bacterium]
MLQLTATDAPLVQAGFFKPVVETLESAGVSTFTLLRQASLHRFDLSVTENYVPVKLMYRLFDKIKCSEGIDDFFKVFARQVKLQSLSDWGETLAIAPDVLSACQIAVEFDNVVQTHERMHFKINGPVSRLSQYYQDQPQAGRDYAVYLNFCLMLNGFKLAGGPGWYPLEIHLQSHEAPSFDYLLPPGYQTKIYLGQPMTSVVFPTSLLSRAMLADGRREVGRKEFIKPQSLNQIIELLMASSLNGQVAHLETVSEMLEVSPRTLRRRLAEQGTSFSRLVDQWRFKTCLGLLEQENLLLLEISERLGYANVPNFERAFKRWTGQTPGTYRDGLPN